MYGYYNKKCYFCGCDDCLNDGLKERISYEKEEYCSASNCRERLNCFEWKYCSLHKKECPKSNCREKISIFDECCSNHSGKRCEHCRSNIVAATSRYCSYCQDNGRKECNQDGCNRITAITDEYCDLHERHNCRFDNCSATVIGRTNYYCHNHVDSCQKDGCWVRTPSGRNYCSEHWYSCQDCQTRISRGNNYCSQHIHNAFDNERSRANNLQTQLNSANTKITRAQTNLGVNNLDDLATELQNSAGTIWSLARWKNELSIERERAEITDNFYRQQFILNNNLEHVRNELSRQILEISQEKQQKEQENEELKEVINSLENLIIQDGDSFLSEKIDNKHEKLEQLKTNLRNRLNGNLCETLEDILEAQKVFIQSNNDLTLSQLRRFKQRLLNSGQQINQAELNEICQVQSELSFLELKLELEERVKIQLQEWVWEREQQRTQTNANHHSRGERNWQNIHPNFTPELVQEWINRGFNCEECQAWINIVAPAQQNTAIREPAYYAWLRDVKRMEPEEVLNGDGQELGQEFLEWYQQQRRQQFEAQQEVPPRY